MSKKDTLIKGTFILTVTGFLSRIIGFFYRIYLSRTFGAEGVGLYQLVFPVFSLGFSLSAAGIEVALSRLTAQKLSLGKSAEAKQVLFTGIAVSFTISALLLLGIQTHAQWIAERLLLDDRCKNLLITLSYLFPFASIHSCICGYYLGQKQTKRIAFSQLIEQIVRVVSVYLLCSVFVKRLTPLPVEIMVVGLVLGEIAASFYCILTFPGTSYISQEQSRHCFRFFKRAKELLSLSVPLTANRVLLNLLQSVEAVSIPGSLLLYGMTHSEALSLYGILTGMAMPCIFFPSALTGSIATMLLPTIAEAQAQGDKQTLTKLMKKVSASVFSLGCFCTACFLLFGNLMGTLLFHNTTAGKLILILAWICPFMYTNTTWISMLNGLGKTSSSFLINTCGLCIRIGSVCFLIPIFGIIGYLWGLLASQILISLLSVTCLHRIYKQLH